MKKLLIVLILVLLASLSLHAVDVEWGGLFYTYTFTWMNADFDADTDDGDMHYYMHGHVQATADFGEGVSGVIRVGDWGNFGMHPVVGVGPSGVGADILHAYVSAQNLFDSPIGITVGQMPVLYGDIAFDGGEEGFNGLKLNVATDMFMLDLFTLRAMEAGGMGFMGTTDAQSGNINPGPDTDLHGAWATVNIPDVDIEINGFGFLRKMGDDMPIWIGARSAGSPIEGLSYVGDFAMMMGSDAADNDYKGMYYSARANYTFEPFTVGGGYYYFGGDDPTTPTEYEGYTSPTGLNLGGSLIGSPYPNGFYKAWPGFGPAYTLRSPYAFSLVVPNLNVINANAGFAGEGFSLRGDFFMYSLVEEDPVNYVADETAMGMEIAIHGTFDLSEQLSIGGTAGYWMPGDAFTGEDAMLGGYLYLAKGF